MKQYELLISGCGGAGTHVARAAAADGRATIAGLCDPSTGALEILHEEFPGAETGCDFQELLARMRPDVAVIACPDHLHADQAVAAAETGCHLLIEKPLATTVSDARRIIDAAESRRIIAMTDHTMRYVYPFRQMSELARAGTVGRIFYLQGDYVHDMWSYYTPDGGDYTPWRADRGHPQNILLGGGCHPIDLILWTVGSPVAEVSCYANKLSIPEFPSDDCYLLTMRFENGAIAKVHVTSGCSGHGMGDFLEIYGTAGTLSKGVLYRRNTEPEEVRRPAKDTVIGSHGWGGSVTDFLDTLDGKMENPIPAVEGARTVAVFEAALRSIRSRRSEPVEIV